MREAAPIMDLLKASTAQQHRDAEGRRLQRALVKGDIAPADYARWIGQMLLIHSALHQQIVRHTGACSPLAAVVRDGGLHVANLQTDLGSLGVNVAEVTPLPATTALIEAIEQAAATDPAVLLGFNYVLEGSMNGNRFIARAMSRGVQPAALKYLDPYGEHQREIWGSYRERMNDLTLDPAQVAGILQAAAQTFDSISQLSDELMPERAGGSFAQHQEQVAEGGA